MKTTYGTCGYGICVSGATTDTGPSDGCVIGPNSTGGAKLDDLLVNFPNVTNLLTYGVFSVNYANGASQETSGVITGR